MVESLGLRLRTGRGSEGSLGICGRGGLREELDLLIDSAAQVVEGFTNVRRVVVSFVGILRADRFESIM